MKVKKNFIKKILKRTKSLGKNCKKKGLRFSKSFFVFGDECYKEIQIILSDFKRKSRKLGFAKYAPLKIAKFKFTKLYCNKVNFKVVYYIRGR